VTAEPHDVLAAALAYASLGWSVIPVRAHAKVPLVKWEEFQRRRASAAEIEAWYARSPRANVGVVTGAVSGLAVLDVDPRHGGDASLALWEREHGPLPDTVEAATGGGGRHLYFRAPEPAPRNRVGLAQGIDLRCEGGLVVAPPSLHPGGGRYVWRDGRDPGTRSPTALPAWLARMLAGAAPRAGHPLAHWRALVREGVAEGARNSTIASLAGHLLWHGSDPEVVLELMLAWNRARCRPPLEDEEVARVVASIARLHARDEP
jgi:hypothetical protein